MRTSAAKAKGRRLCQKVKEMLHAWAPDLRDGDIEVTSSGACGEDLKLSPAARDIFPVTIECKNQEKIAVWAAYEQATTHVKGEGIVPLLIFARNRSEPMVALKLEDFLWLVKR